MLVEFAVGEGGEIVFFEAWVEGGVILLLSLSLGKGCEIGVVGVVGLLGGAGGG